YNPYTMSFNFGIQQEIYRGAVVEVRYVGSRIIGQFQTINGNPDLRFLALAGQDLVGDPTAFTNGILAPGATAANNFDNRPGTNGAGRVDPAFGAVRTRINGANSTYHGLQTRFDTRIRNVLTLNMNYTFSKTLDNASEIFGTLGGGQSVPISQNPFDTNGGERGLSAFHQKHNFVASFLYDLPFFSEQRGVVGKILGGYQLNGIVRMGSGRPYTPVTILGQVDPGFETAFNTGGVGVVRPFNGNPNASEGTIAYGSTAAGAVFGLDVPAGQFIVFDTRQPGSAGTIVSASQALEQSRLIYNDFGLFNLGIPLEALDAVQLFKTPYGDVGRNTFLGEPFYLANVSLFKNLKLTENKSLEFRVEAFNVLNHRNFGVPDPLVEDAFNGFAVSTFQNPGQNNGGSRTMRLGVRFLF
ncbi:MAG TPA: hypothetical protein VNH22_07860, partial [Blastocatellia bacterium]|nr:hypothetical protein [Blastocatellia bacterium]